MAINSYVHIELYSMKIKTISTLLLTTLLYCSCNVEEPVGKPHDDASALHVGISCVQTKTWLDYQAGGSPLKVYWSNGDKINVNGVSSLSLSVEEGSKTTVADFSLYGVEAPYNVIYPASIVTELVYDEEGYINVELPSSQAYHPTSFAEGSAIMCGYSEDADVTLKNLCAAVRVNVKGTDEVVAATVISTSAPLCGHYRLNPQSASLAPVEGSAEVSLEFTENITLNAENGVDFFFTVPAADYSEGLSFFFKNVEGRNLECIWRPDAPLEAGKLYSFNDVEYVPGAKDITTAEEWNEFAAAVNAGEEGAEVLQKYLYKGGFVRLGADIQAEGLSQITSDFTYIFDGNGYSITREAATAPLFASVSGVIKNLSLAGSLDLGEMSGSPLVYTLMPGGKISSCANNMSVTASTQSDTYVSGLVTVMQGGTIESCINNGVVDVTIDVDAGIYYVGVAGIVADVQADQDDLSVLLKDCINSSTGALTLSPALTFKASASTKDKGMKACALAGIAGFVRSSANYTFDNCDNEGPITLSAKNIAHANGNSCRPVSVGGILGLAAPLDDVGTLKDPAAYEQDGFALSLRDCDNKGLIYNCGVTYATTTQSKTKMFTGGIAGSIAGRDEQYANIVSCTNTGNIITYDIIADTPGYVVSGRPAYCAVAGGLVGFGGYLNIDGCSTDCQIGNGRRPMVAWGGVIGYTVRPFIVNNTSLNLSGYYQRLDGYKMNRAVVAVVPVKYNTSAMDLVPNVSGSKITGYLSVSGYVLTSASTITSDSEAKDLSGTLSTKIFSGEEKVKENLVCGQGFTANADVDSSSANITYSAH